jgi:small GTP-binding protein
MNTESYEFMFKVVLVGDMSVGKTNIIAKYLKNDFSEDYKTTIGVEFHSKIAKVEGHVVKAQIWDTCGQERFKSITDSYYRGAKGAFVVYDITRKNTFESVDSWISALRSAADKNLNIIIIGNKSDLEDQRQVETEQGEEKAQNNEAAFLETSAYSGDNIDKAFDNMITDVYNKCKSEMLANVEIDIGKSKDINLNQNKEDKKGKKCC